jgi:hypothetical protein
MKPTEPSAALASIVMLFVLAVLPVPAEPLPSGKDNPGQPTDPDSVKPPTAASAADDSPSAGQPFKLLGLIINSRGRCVDIEATICLDEGALELIACTKGSKEHESVIAVEARPSLIHTALLLLGARSGSPAMRRPANEEQTRWVDIPPTGDLIDVFLEFNNAEGKRVERPISDFIRRRIRDGIERPKSGTEADKAQSIPHAFIFAGSHLKDDGDGPRGYLADISGHVISMSTFGDELLCLSELHSHQQGALEWEIDPTHLPMKGTAVTLRLRLKKSSEPKSKP